MKLLIQGSNILAADARMIVSDDRIFTYTPEGKADGEFPLHVIEGWQIVDVEVPDGFTCAGYKWNGAAVEKKAAPALSSAEKAELVNKVDMHIAGIYAKWMRFEAEYKEREAAARDFAAGGYVGDPGVWVTSFSTSAGLPNDQAANLIISQADALHNALKNLGALRMTKYAIQSSADADSIIAQADAIAKTLA